MNKPKVKQISETLFEIPELNNSVKLQKKRGRTLLICSCQNHTRFCNENPWCYHKQLVVEYIINKPILVRLNKLINSYKGFEGIVGKINTTMILDDLKNLKNLIK